VSYTPTVPSQAQLALLSHTIAIWCGPVICPEKMQRISVNPFRFGFLNGDYDVFDRFAGRSSLRTYLTVVVRRMLLDWRNAAYGKWRPSAAALRLGGDAVGLDRLIHRDGYTADEAIQIYREKRGAPSDGVLRRLAEQLPPRQRRRMVSAEALDAAVGAAFEDPIDAAERQRSAQRIRTALATALHLLPSEDRRLLELRYRQGHSVRAVAQLLQMDPKPLYRRFERSLRALQRTARNGRSHRARHDSIIG